MGKKIVIYTDASYDEKLRVAACGYVTLIDFKMNSHNVYLVSKIYNVKDAEEYAITLALRDLTTVKMFDTILINTDCLLCIQHPFKKSSKIHNNFKKTIRELTSAGIKITMQHVKAHSNNYFNSMVDVSCRKHLRAHRTKNNSLI